MKKWQQILYEVNDKHIMLKNILQGNLIDIMLVKSITTKITAVVGHLLVAYMGKGKAVAD